MKKTIILILFTLFSLFSCARMLKDTEIREYENLRTAIIASFPTHYNVSIYNFANLMDESDYDYMKSAIPNMLYNYLKPIEKERILVDFNQIPILPTGDVEKIVFATNSMFSNYVSNFTTTLTQFRYQTTTNRDFVLVYKKWDYLYQIHQIASGTRFLRFTFDEEDFNTNGTTTIVQTNLVTYKNGARLTNTNVTIIHCQIQNAMTNLTVIESRLVGYSQIVTNISLITTKDYKRLIVENYPELTNLVRDVSIRLVRENTNRDKNFTNTDLSAVITGDYDIRKERRGTASLEVYLRLSHRITNNKTVELNLKTTENTLADSLFRFVKPVRKQILNKPTGDIIVISSPPDASIYLDDIFIGKSPLYYPAVSIGKHSFSFIKEGYEELFLFGIVEADRTNFISENISKTDTSGVIRINSAPTNAIVFLDSVYVGVTPLVLSNVSLNIRHRLKLIPAEEKLKPLYHAFMLESSKAYEYHALFQEFEGFPQSEKQAAWLWAFGSWGVTVGILGVNIFADTMYKYYTDLDQVGNTNINLQKRRDYESLMNNSIYAFVGGCIVSSFFTANALSKEEIFLGFSLNPLNNETKIHLNWKY